MIRLRGGARTSRSALCHAVTRDSEITTIAEKGAVQSHPCLRAPG